MLSATRTLMKNGRRAMLGVCACCGTKMSVAGKWDDEAPDDAIQKTGTALADLEGWKCRSTIE